MTKKFNKATKASLATLLATSAIVPVASANTEAVANDIVSVVFEYEPGKFAKYSLDEYGFNLSIGAIKNTNISHVIDNGGNIYTLDDYGFSLGLANGDKTAAFESLKKENVAVDIKPTEGSIDENGNVVGKDETPEENVNETFFYNLAA